MVDVLGVRILRSVRRGTSLLMRLAKSFEYIVPGVTRMPILFVDSRNRVAGIVLRTG